MKRNHMGRGALTKAVLIGLALLVAGVGSVAAQAGPAKSKIEDVVAKGTLRVGLDFFVPWAFKGKDGNLVGFEIDVAKKLAADIGVQVEFVPTAWSGIIPALLTDKFDVIIGGLGVTAERALKVNYSDPYEWSGIDVVVNKKKDPGLTTLEALNKKKIVLAVGVGSTPAIAAKQFLPQATLHQFDSGEQAVLQEVLNGNADAALVSTPTGAYWAADYPANVYRPLDGKLLKTEPSAFAVRKGDPDTIAFFNSWILINQEWLKDRSHYWYETRDWKGLLPKN